MSDIKPTPYSKDYEITDAMFGVFRSPGGMPFFWKLFFCGTVLFFAFGLFAFPAMIETHVDFIRVSVLLEQSPSEMGPFWKAFGDFSLVWTGFVLGYVIIVALIRAAFFRCYFFGDSGAQIPIQFGRDELRQVLAILGFFGLLIGAALVSTLLIVVFLAILFTISADGLIGLLIVGLILLYIVQIVLFVWVGVRFYCAGALTAYRRETCVWAARTVSINRFWALFGSILVAGLIGYVVTYLAGMSALLMAFSGLASSDLFTILSGLDPEGSLEAIERATETASVRLITVIAIALTSAGYSFYTLILAGPQAFFTKQWAEAAEDIESVD